MYLDESGFGPSLRGGDCVCFGMPAIEEFLQANHLSFIVRAHEAHAHGVSLSKAAKYSSLFLFSCNLALECSPSFQLPKIMVKVERQWLDVFLLM